MIYCVFYLKKVDLRKIRKQIKHVGPAWSRCEGSILLMGHDCGGDLKRLSDHEQRVEETSLKFSGGFDWNQCREMGSLVNFHRSPDKYHH